mgnify:FL=1
MPSTLIPTLLLQILVISYTPGPANIYTLAMVLRHGKKKTLIMWLGLLAGFSIAVCIMAILTHLIGIAFGQYVTYLKYFGAAYILYLTYKIWKDSDHPQENGQDCTFISGMIVQLTNAKMLLFDLTAFSTFVLPYSSRMIDLLKVAAWLLIAGPGANLAWLLAGSYLRRFFINYKHRIDHICAIALFLCAIYIIL